MAVQKVELPERMRPVERLRKVLLDRRRERRVVSGRRYALLDEVAAKIEVDVVRPHQLAEVRLVARHALPKRRIFARRSANGLAACSQVISPASGRTP